MCLPEVRNPRKCEEDQAEVDRLEGLMTKIRRGEVVIPDMNYKPLPWAAGTAGHLDIFFTVNQVVSPTDMIVSPSAAQVQELWMSGYPTAGIADDQRTEITGDFAVCGTKSYTTAMGAPRTILVISSVDSSNLKPAVDYLILQSHQSPSPYAGQ